jgi:hypothetical protein
MANCCANSFYSDSLDAPDCSIDCIETATPGAIFVGASGDIYILTGEDPCVLLNWTPQANCCLTFTNLTDSVTVCCNEELILTSSDDSITITFDEDDGLDFVVNFSFTLLDDYAGTFDIINGETITLSDQNGIVVEVVSDGVFMFSGNSYSSAGTPVATPTHASMINYNFDTTNNVLYVWKPSAVAWVRINYLPLPVALFSYTKGGLDAVLNGTGSTSTQNGTTITYQWTGSGPAGVVFGTATASTTTATFTVPGEYTITLTVTDSNGASKAYSQILDIEPKDKCDVEFEIPDIAFVDPSNPTDAEVNTWITANGPFNNHTILYSIGDGSITSPDFIWHYTC